MLTLVTLASIPLFVVLSLVMRPLLRERLGEKFDRGAENQSYLVEAVTGVQTVKAMALEPVFYRRWEVQLARYVTASFRTSHLSGIGSALGQSFQKLSTLSILWVGAYLVMRGQLTVGQLIAFQMLSARVVSPILRTVQLWQDFQQVGISIDRLGDLINTPAEPALNPGKMSLPAIRGAVRLENVRFRYQFDGPEILKNLSCEIAPGTTIGVVGRSGSGKSTLAKLLQRLYTPESGRVLIDGIDLSQADPFWLRRQIGVVLQESFLFNGTVRENIAIQFPGASMNEVVEAAKLAGAHEFILELPEAYDSPVGERGTALSGGQRQRIAIARALLPPLLEIQETPPSPLKRWMAGTLIALVVALVIWATVGQISIVATAPGKFIPDGHLKEVQPLESSIVRGIDVTEGQHVRKGQLLVELDPTLSAAQLQANAQKYGFNRLEQARLISELTNRKPDFAGLDQSRARILLEERIRGAQERDYAAKLAEARASIREKSAPLAAAQATLEKYQKLSALAAQQVSSARPLVPIGAIAKIDYLKLEEALVQDDQDFVAEQKTVQQDEAALTEAQQALHQVKGDQAKDLYHELAQRVADEPTLKGDYDKSKKLYALEWLRSPVDGVVQSINVTTVGQVVTPAQSLVTIVPDGTPLIIEATVSNNDIGYIKVGQPVQVKVDTFPFEQYGTLRGTLVWISPDAEDKSAISRDIDTRTGAIGESPPQAQERDSHAGFVYKVHIRTARAQFMVNGQPRSVEPGMTVQADILTGRRRVIEFFLSPLVKYLNEGLRVR